MSSRIVVAAAALAVTIACADRATAPQSCTLTAMPTPSELQVGAVVQLRVAPRCDRGAVPALRWSTSAPGVVQVDSLGRVTPVSIGAAVVTVSLVGQPAARVDIPFTVRLLLCGDIQPGVMMTPFAATIAIGASVQLVAEAPPRRCPPTPPATTFRWRSSDSTVAAVDSSGRVTGRKAGTAVVVATAVADTNLQGRSAITVLP